MWFLAEVAREKWNSELPCRSCHVSRLRERIWQAPHPAVDGCWMLHGACLPTRRQPSALAALRLSDESQRTFVPDSSAKGPTTFAGSMRIHQSLSHRSHDTDGEGSSHCQLQQRTTEAANMNRHARIQSSRTAGLASVVPFARRAPPIEATVPIESYNAMGLPSQVWDA